MMDASIVNPVKLLKQKKNDNLLKTKITHLLKNNIQLFTTLLAWPLNQTSGPMPKKPAQPHAYAHKAYSYWQEGKIRMSPSRGS